MDVCSVDSDRVVGVTSVSIDGDKDDRDLSVDRLKLFQKRIALPSSSSSNDFCSDRSGEDLELDGVAKKTDVDRKEETPIEGKETPIFPHRQPAAYLSTEKEKEFLISFISCSLLSWQSVRKCVILFVIVDKLEDFLSLLYLPKIPTNSTFLFRFI